MALLSFDYTLKTYIQSDSVTGNQWMVSEAPNLYMVDVPYRTPFNLDLVGVNLWVASGTDCKVEIYKGSDIVSSPNPANAIFIASGLGWHSASYNIDGYKKIGVYYRTTGVTTSYPQAELFFKLTPEAMPE